ncbi:neuronal acetylcholine receptor subunit alpha-10-like isoform X2 [Amphiura filiformis]|uniref:neuronal acetylcholine receptor subunit alpha-10-like isoform X2 n=1 Tax=Amphiura filiformis TaxID=82378 RepID=UPI003B20F746
MSVIHLVVWSIVGVYLMCNNSGLGVNLDPFAPPPFAGIKAANSNQGRLIEFLLDNYETRGYVRPVMDSSTVTRVTLRLLFHNLIQMDTRNQKFTIGVWIKMTWTDEFLRWNASDFGGIEFIHLPVDLIWKPDITLEGNVDLDFERYKPGTVVLVNSDGFISWLTPSIMTSYCRVRVHNFPFDTQVCEMVFASWSFTTLDIDLYPELGPDAAQNRYLDDGVWDMVSVKVSRKLSKYSCCPAPFSELYYHLIFKRRSEFYVIYLICPCVFLSLLSLLVFYLPAECGEKLTLSITNLLALVVFQQVIAETMPPSGDGSPIIGTYFLTMIVVVCVSVVSTVFIIHVSHNERPVPPWVRWLFLRVLRACVCINSVPPSSHFVKKHEEKAIDICEKEALNVNNHTGGIDDNDRNDISVSLRVFHDENRDRDRFFCSELADIRDSVEYLRRDLQERNHQGALRGEWKQVVAVMDRCLLLFFFVFTVVCTSVLMVKVVIDSAAEFEREVTHIHEGEVDLSKIPQHTDDL